MTTDIFNAWAAGFFDGEGCVIVSVSKGKGQIWTSLHVSVSQLDRTPLDALVETFGGNVVAGKTTSSWRKRKTEIFKWLIYNKEALVFLGTIQPYTMVKTDEINLALTYPVSKGKPWCRAWNPMPQWAKDKRFEIRQGLIDIRAGRRVEITDNLIQFDQNRKEVAG